MQDDNLKKAKAYSKIRHNLALFEILFMLIFLLLIQSSGLSIKFEQLARSLTSNEIFIIALYLFILSFFYNIFSFWFDYYSGYKLEHRFGLSRQNLFSWFKDYVKRIMLGGILSLISIEILYFFMRKFTHLWWLCSAGFWLFFSLFIARIFPIFIIPLFYKLEKFKGQTLREKLLNLADKAHIKILDIYRIGLGAKTSKANAALVGIGSSKRILLSDTLLTSYTPDEIEATLAHELAHYKYRHFWKLILLNAIDTILVFLLIHLIFYFALSKMLPFAIYDIETFPIFAFIYVSFNFIATPLLNAISRYFESQADKEAIILTQRPSAFISLMEKLTRQNLSDPTPSKIIEIFFYDHPPAAMRIKAAQQA